LNPERRCRTFRAQELSPTENRSAVMPKTAGISSSTSQHSDSAQLVSIAQFSGVGLLVSLVIVLLRMNGVF
jgi:hypothetical protein